MKSRILFIDIETFANHSRTWAGKMYETNVIKITKSWEIASFAYQWNGEKKVYCETREGQKNDLKLMRKLRDVIDKADILVVQNGKKFDIPSWNTRLTKHGIPLPSPFQVIDTCTESRKYLKLDSYSLDFMCEYFGIGQKLKHPGFIMWELCEQDDPKAWKKMVRYNKHDVYLMGRYYNEILLPFLKHPNLAVISGKPNACPKCESEGTLHSRGFTFSGQKKVRKFWCSKCRGWCTARQATKATKPNYVN